jgi:hypothetical protein
VLVRVRACANTNVFKLLSFLELLNFRKLEFGLCLFHPVDFPTSQVTVEFFLRYTASLYTISLHKCLIYLGPSNSGQGSTKVSAGSLCNSVLIGSM